MKVKIILNPYAGRWKAQRALPDVERACAEVGLDYDLVTTEGPGHGIELAREAAAAGYDAIVAAGGDGSISEVVNGMLAASEGAAVPVPLGILPLGSADDLADMLALPKDLVQACRIIARGHRRRLDLGRVNGRYFDNNSAVGLEPMVTVAQERMLRVRGTPRYVLAALYAIASHSPWRMRIVWDGGEFEGDVALVSVGNTRRTGGVFYMTPHAEPDDGLLDFAFAEGMPRRRLLRLLPTAFDGSHVHHPAVHYGRTRRLTIECSPATPIQADGELFDGAATYADYQVLPGRLSVLVPEGTG
jgi:YegS/Rv2252/BmrU family lipid kinase